MIQSITLSLLALLLASGIALGQAAPETPVEAPAAPAPQPAEPPKTDRSRDPDLFPKTGDDKYAPEVGQAGKDVIWVPTPQTTVDRMLEMAAAKPGDYLIDLGSGDGRTVITAAKRGIRALGIEYNPDMVELSRRNAAREGVGDRAQFVHGDIFKTDFSQATVLTMYLLSRLNLKLRPTILSMKPGTRVVSHSFDMGDWKADQGVDSSGDPCIEFCSAYHWVVPARVAGTWRTPAGRLRLTQKYQTFTGTLRTGGKRHKIEDGRVRGEELTFTAGDKRYSGTVKGRKLGVKGEPVKKVVMAVK